MRTLRPYWLSLVMLIFCHASLALTSLEITEKTLSVLPQCLHYQVKGLCYWLSPSGTTLTTPYIAHFLPDVVVSVFDPPTDQKGGNAWEEIHQTLDQGGRLVQQELLRRAQVPVGGGEHRLDAPEPSVFFKEVDVIGNPALVLLPSNPVLLSSMAVPGRPYFQSMFDSLSWRGVGPQSSLEQADAVVQNPAHTIGSLAGLIHWGGVFPYQGKVVSNNEAKAAAVIGFRATHLLTAPNRFGHVFQPLPTQCGVACTAATIQENHPHTRWQRLTPKSEGACQVFGQTADYGEDLSAKAKGGYVWVLWRYYEGCIEAPRNYLGRTIIH